MNAFNKNKRRSVGRELLSLDAALGKCARRLTLIKKNREKERERERKKKKKATGGLMATWLLVAGWISSCLFE